MTHHHDSHDDLQPVIEQLRANRPELSSLELDMVKQRVRGRATAPRGRRARSANLMKSRLTILTALVLGMTLSTAGAGLAVGGFASGSDDASVAQYGPNKPSNQGDVLPEQDQSAPRSAEDDVAGETDEGLQPTRQLEAGVQSGDDSGELPFTGFAAIPILIGGVALLSTGMILRRRAGDQD